LEVLNASLPIPEDFRGPEELKIDTISADAEQLFGQGSRESETG
jgi:hypothetical protein